MSQLESQLAKVLEQMGQRANIQPQQPSFIQRALPGIAQAVIAGGNSKLQAAGLPSQGDSISPALQKQVGQVGLGTTKEEIALSRLKLLQQQGQLKGLLDVLGFQEGKKLTGARVGQADAAAGASNELAETRRQTRKPTIRKLGLEINELNVKIKGAKTDNETKVLDRDLIALKLESAVARSNILGGMLESGDPEQVRIAEQILTEGSSKSETPSEKITRLGFETNDPILIAAGLNRNAVVDSDTGEVRSEFKQAVAFATDPSAQAVAPWFVPIRKQLVALAQSKGVADVTKLHLSRREREDFTEFLGQVIAPSYELILSDPILTEGFTNHILLDMADILKISPEKLSAKFNKTALQFKVDKLTLESRGKGGTPGATIPVLDFNNGPQELVPNQPQGANKFLFEN